MAACARILGGYVTGMGAAERTHIQFADPRQRKRPPVAARVFIVGESASGPVAAENNHIQHADKRMREAQPLAACARASGR